MPRVVELPAGLRPKTVPASLYILLTGDSYGKGLTTTPAAMISTSQIQKKHGNVSRENMLSAFRRLVFLGLLENTGTFRSHNGRALTGRLNEKYVVVKSREEALGAAPFTPAETPEVPTPHVRYTTPSAPTSVAPASTDTRAPLDQRVAALEDQVANLLAALRNV